MEPPISRTAIELADIFRRHGERYRATHRLLPYQHRLMRAIEQCRTAALGGHVEQCSHCQHRRIAYNSCRNRHCPKCQNLARAQWLARRTGELLPVEYFHVVFTIPSTLYDLAWQNKQLVYKLLFQASAKTLQTIAADPKHLGAAIGFFSILHTWGQNLQLHPHIHCVATGGGIAPDGSRWISTKPGFFLPVRVLSRLFRRLLLEALQKAFHAKQLSFHAAIEPLAQQDAFAKLLRTLSEREWVVYAKPPFGGPQQVLEYLGRYTHRVAISNRRLLAFDGEQVTFQYKDYRRSGREKHKRMTLAADELIRRFMLHSLPPGFQRVRHYGFLASSRKRRQLALARQLLQVLQNPVAPQPGEIAAAMAAILQPIHICPVCRTGTMIVTEHLPVPPRPIGYADTS